MKKENVKELFDSRFIKVFDLQYEEGRHYFDATRRDKENLAALKDEAGFRRMLPDAVSCFVVLKTKTSGARLLMSYEYRYPTGHYLLSVPAGLIDPDDEKLESDTDVSLSNSELVPQNGTQFVIPSENSSSRNSPRVPQKTRQRDKNSDPILEAARREIHEETNLTIRDTDRLEIINPLVFSTPGMTDESNALVLAVISVDDLSVLNQKGAVGSEKFDGFVLLSQADARRIIRKGVDDNGHFYPLYSWAAMMYFLSDAWRKDDNEAYENPDEEDD